MKFNFNIRKIYKMSFHFYNLFHQLKSIKYFSLKVNNLCYCYWNQFLSIFVILDNFVEFIYYILQLYLVGLFKLQIHRLFFFSCFKFFLLPVNTDKVCSILIKFRMNFCHSTYQLSWFCQLL